MFSNRKLGVIVMIIFFLVLAASIGIKPGPAIAFPFYNRPIPSGGEGRFPQQDYPLPKDAFVLRDPFVSDPVMPADTTGLPPAPAVESLDPSKDSIWIVPNAFPYPEDIKGTTGEYPTGDPAVQSRSGKVNMPSPIVNFEGLNNTTSVIPPDTDGQVGPNHYVQIVNSTVVGIYNKSTGGLLYPTFLLKNLWPGGDPCNNPDRGDPIVLYDQLADRWLLTQFYFPLSGSDPAPPYYECIAVSKGAAPTNVPSDWHLYTFLVHNTKMNDYPKLGVWPDGYYMSANQFDPNWAGTGVWVFDRSNILTGSAATFQYFDLATVNINYWALLPSNLMGNTQPPSGAPNYFVSVDQNWSGSNDIMHIFEFHTDWATPANSTFGLVSDLVVNTFDYSLCADSWNRCIHQPDSAPKLDALSYRAMMHLWYRNFNSHESLVVNHTVDADGAGRAGIRWYEIRGGTVNTTLADASIYQQGTYAPDDGLHRWMGSIAMDQDGNMALGYSVSSTSVYPSIRYAGRLASDPLHTLPQAEVEIIAGSGVQTHTTGRWGDYSAMSVDPVDDCTFWYTQEYIQTTGLDSWQTRIASFKFPSCPITDRVYLPNLMKDFSPDVTPTATNTPTPTATPTPTPTPTTTPPPGTFYSIGDATVLQGYSSTNFGSTEDMWAGYDDYLSPDGMTARSLIQFDVSPIPSGTTISNATLRVYLVYSWDFPGESRTITTYRPNSTWSESVVTWSNHPSPVESYGSTSVTHGSWRWYSFDVTNLVQGWVNNSIPNYGIMLRGPEHSGSDSSVKGFSSREGPYTPELVITYGGSSLVPGTGRGSESSLGQEGAIPIIEVITGESTNWANSCQDVLQQRVMMKCLSYR